jgi:hypothetical protein
VTTKLHQCLFLADFDEEVRGARNNPRGLEMGSLEGDFLELNFPKGGFEEHRSNEFPRQVFVRTFSSVSALRRIDASGRNLPESQHAERTPAGAAA